MEIFEAILSIVNLIILYLLYTLKETVDSQKKIIESFQSQSEFLQNLQSTLSGIYDPTKIKDVLEVEKMKLRQLFEDEISGYKREMETLEEEKNNLMSKYEEYEKEGEDLGEQINLFGHNILVIFFSYHINLMESILNTRKGLVIYTFLYEKHFKGTEPDPISLDFEITEIEKSIELKIELLDLDQLREIDLGVHNNLYPKINEVDYEKFMKRVIEIRDTFTPLLDNYFNLGDRENA